MARIAALHLSLAGLLGVPRPPGLAAAAPRLLRRRQAAAGVREDMHPDSHLPKEAGHSLLESDRSRVDACNITFACGDTVHQPARRIAVYTYNIGDYEAVASDHVPCVPPHVDAFLFMDGHAMKQHLHSPELSEWQKRGWKLQEVGMVPGSEYVTAARLTSKSLKFTPPDWLLNGTWDWLVEHDGNMRLDLNRLGPFLEGYASRALVLPNWNYHYPEDCGQDGFKCFEIEVTSMLTERQEYIQMSKRNILKWKELLEKMHRGQHITGGRKYMPPSYYESSAIFRNLKHPRAGEVQEAFRKIYEKCHNIQRDQFLIPVLLWQGHLTEDTEAAPLNVLAGQAGYCMVDTRRGRN